MTLLFAERRWTAGLLSAVVVAGCGGSETGQVSGTLLRKDGTPLVGARVVARSAETGKSAHGTTDSDGRFELRTAEQGYGLAAGDYHVIVLEDRGDPDSRRPLTIAEKYRDPATSGLKLKSKSGQSQELNLTLDPR